MSASGSSNSARLECRGLVILSLPDAAGPRRAALSTSSGLLQETID